MTKICYKCKIEKSKSLFCKDKNKKDGLESYCKECKKEYRLKNRDKKIVCDKQYYKENKELIKVKKKKWREENKEYCKQWYKDNKEYHNQYKKQRYKTDLNYKLRENLRRRVRIAVKGINKSESTMELVGCTIEELKTHLSNQFKEGMTWDNYGLKGWHIDHIKPCCSFDLSKEKEQKKCFHYSNLQPLWAEENLKKGGNYVN